jgi:hypothetical protein
MVTNGGVFSATWNSTAQAVDLVNNDLLFGWFSLTNLIYASDYYVEADLEVVSNFSVASKFGIQLQDSINGGQQSGGYRVVNIANLWQVHDLNLYNGALRTLILADDMWYVGARKTVRVDWASAAWMPGKVSVDGRVIGYITNNGDGLNTTHRPGIYFSKVSLRLHSVKAVMGATDNSVVRADVAANAMPDAYSSMKFGGATAGQARPLAARGFDVGLGRMNKYIFGETLGTISGVLTAKRVPVQRRVRLFDKRTGAQVDATTSDQDGRYSFANLFTTREYFAVAQDHTLTYDAVVLDNLRPVPQ